MTRWLRLACLSAFVLAIPSLAFAQWDTPNRSFHKATAFPLEGRHQTVACESCHINRMTKGTPTACETCHWERRQDDVYKLRLGTNCRQCHTPTSWTSVKWDHNAMTGTALNASHRTLSCDSCHKNAQFANVRLTCIECHRRDYDATKAPNHKAAGFSTSCDSCHRVSDTIFTQAHFDHSATYPLLGMHATASCDSCHKNNVYKGTARDCSSCHLPDYFNSRNPNHTVAGFNTTCDSCHKNSDPTFHQGKYAHTSFPIASGVHVGISCNTCHTNAATFATFSCMNGCHDKTTTDRNHQGRAGYSYVATACYACHPQGHR